ncbi:MAG: TRAP transporter small permease subunit [Burkholderiaceae bacterium]
MAQSVNHTLDRWLDHALTRLHVIARWAARAGGALLLSGAIIVSVDVIARKLLNVSLGGADELSGYAFAIGTAWSFAFVAVERGNVRVDALYAHLPRSVAAALDALALIALLAFAGVVAWYGWDVLAGSFNLSSRSNSALAVPLWIPQALWWGGYAVFTVTLLMLLARVLIALSRRDFASVSRFAGARSTEEDAQSEIDNARAATVEPAR